MMLRKFVIPVFICACMTAFTFAQSFKKSPTQKENISLAGSHGKLVTESIESTILKDNLVGLDPKRMVKVFLPRGYAQSGKSYPVVYYLHSLFWSPEKMFQDGNLQNLLERATDSDVTKEFIFVAADYSTKTTGSFYENSSVSGRWLDFTVQELIPFIDSHFRTIANRDSRAVVGDYMGGRGALQLAMLNSNVFSVVYAMHPVATGTGYLPWANNGVDWKKIYQARSNADLEGGQVFIVAMHQAFLPNPKRPPFYCDFYMEPENGEPVLSTDNVIKTQRNFLLDRTLEHSAANLKTMRGIAFDWARYDPVQDHVYSARSFTGKLDDLGIEHEAEEYRGNPWNKNWTADGRFYTRVLPFLAKHLAFDAP